MPVTYAENYYNRNAAGATLEGHAEVNQMPEEENKIFTGEIDKLESKTKIKMSVSQVLSTGLTQEGDEFFAEMTGEVEGDKGLVLPSGTIAHGHVHRIEDGKRLGRDGYIELVFDYLITPDGREIPIEGKMSTKLNPIASTAKILAEDSLYTVAGGLVGGMAAVQLFGVEAAIASQGYTVMGGAAAGAAVGLGLGLVRKGKSVSLEPGKDFTVKLTAPVDLPVIAEDAFKQEEILNENLIVKINNIKLHDDPFGTLNTITLQLSVNNYTPIDFSSYDIGLLNDYNKVFYPSIFGDTSLFLNKIKSGDRVAGHISFTVDNPKRKHWLVFYDRRSRQILAKISVDNAQVDINKKKKRKNKKGA